MFRRCFLSDIAGVADEVVKLLRFIDDMMFDDNHLVFRVVWSMKIEDKSIKI